MQLPDKKPPPPQLCAESPGLWGFWTACYPPHSTVFGQVLIYGVQLFIP